MKTEKIIEIFKSEFELISDKFQIIEESVKNLKNSTMEYIYNPGVYVFFKNDGIIKVGRHLTNSRKRALEHLRDNTKSDSFEMNTLTDFPDSKVLLFNLKNPDNSHWAAAVEIFLEKNLHPLIKTQRL